MALRKPSPSQSNIAWVPTASAPSKREDLKVPAAMDKHRCGRHRMVLEAVVASLHAGGSKVDGRFPAKVRQHGNSVLLLRLGSPV